MSRCTIRCIIKYVLSNKAVFKTALSKQCLVPLTCNILVTTSFLYNSNQIVTKSVIRYVTPAFLLFHEAILTLIIY